MTEKRETVVRQEQITQAALRLIAQHGLKHVSMATLARGVGLVPSAIYRHFASKDEVVDAVLELVRDRLQQNVREVTLETADALEQIERVITRHVALIRESRGVMRVVFSDEIQGKRRAKVFRTIEVYLQGVADMVRHGQRQGTIRRDADPDTVALMVLGIIQPAAILWHMSDGRVDIARHAREAWRILRDAIAAR